MYNVNDPKWIKGFKKRLTEIRKKKYHTQKDFAEALNKEKSFGGRTAITNWESINQQTLPNLLSFFEICDALDVDANYLAGATKYENLKQKDICESLNITKDTADMLKTDPNLGTFIDTLIKTKALIQIITRMNSLAIESVVMTAIQSNLKAAFISKLEKIYDRYYFTTIPSDVNEDSWYSYLLSNDGIPYSVYNSPEKFLDQNFLDEGIMNLHFSNENYDKLNNLEKHEAILELVADMSYNYLTRKAALEFSKRDIADRLNKVVDEYINSEKNKILDQLKIGAQSK